MNHETTPSEGLQSRTKALGKCTDQELAELDIGEPSARLAVLGFLAIIGGFLVVFRLCVAVFQFMHP